MCFSAGASFAAGAVLSVVGITAIKQSRTSLQTAFAGIPLIFAVQQITEGFVWHSLLTPAHGPWQLPATYIFLLFAEVFWPVWVPFSILLLENNKGRRKILYALSGIGLLISCYLGYRLATQNVNAQIAGMHIAYSVGLPGKLVHYSAILYFIATAAAPFISSVKKMWLFGVAIIISYIVTHIFFEDYELSVWCFFAAVMSAAVFIIILDLKKSFAVDADKSPGPVGKAIHPFY